MKAFALGAFVGYDKIEFGRKEGSLKSAWGY